MDDFIDIFNSARYPRNFDYYGSGKKVTRKVTKKSFDFEEKVGLPVNYLTDDILDQKTKFGVVIIDLNNKNIVHLDNTDSWDFLDFMYIDIDREYPPARKKYERCMERKGKVPEDYPLYATGCYRDAYWLEVNPPKDFTTKHVKFSKPKHRDAVMRELFECGDPSGEFYRSVGACL